MLLASSFGSRGFVLGASALLHVAVIAVAGGGMRHADGLSLAAASPTPEAEIAIDVNPDPVIDQATHPNHVHTHTHAYPVSPDHDAIDHDPSIVHTPYLPHDHDHDDAAHSDPPADAPSDVLTATASAPAALPNFSMVIGASTTAHGFVQTNAVGTGAARTDDDNDAPVAENSVSSAAHLVRSVLPSYPTDARAEEVEADVPMEIVVDKSGAVVNARVETPAGYGFDQAAIAAIRQYRFSPAARAGHIVAVRMKWVVQFRLK